MEIANVKNVAILKHSILKLQKQLLFMAAFCKLFAMANMNG